jgi:hypothetical protein
MEFEYPQLIYLDTTSDTISLDLRVGASEEKYTMLDGGRGSSGVVYVNEDSTRCIKLILYPQGILDDAKERQTHIYENEVRLQNISHSFRFAPAIHRNFRTQIRKNDTEYDVYVIVMDYLNPDFWANIPYHELTPKIMKLFVKKTDLYNDVDPYSHFYRHRTTRQIVMIDYGKVKECKSNEKDDTTLAKGHCIAKMLSTLHRTQIIQTDCPFGIKCYRTSDATERNREGEYKGLHHTLFSHPYVNGKEFVPIDKRPGYKPRLNPYGGSRNKQTNRNSRRRASSRGWLSSKRTRTRRRTRRRRRR